MAVAPLGLTVFYLVADIILGAVIVRRSRIPFTKRVFAEWGEFIWFAVIGILTIAAEIWR